MIIKINCTEKCSTVVIFVHECCFVIFQVIFTVLAYESNIYKWQNEARKLNHQEVVEEDKRNKLPANFEQKRKRVEYEEEQERRRKVRHQPKQVLSVYSPST